MIFSDIDNVFNEDLENDVIEELDAQKAVIDIPFHAHHLEHFGTDGGHGEQYTGDDDFGSPNLIKEGVPDSDADYPGCRVQHHFRHDNDGEGQGAWRRAAVSWCVDFGRLPSA